MLIGIFGTGRNGSTLLTRLLDGIPKTYVHPLEVNFLSAMNDLASTGRVYAFTYLNATTKPLTKLNKKIDTDTLLKYYSYQIKDLKTIYISNLLEKIELSKNPVQQIRLKSEYFPKEFVEVFLNLVAEWVHNNQLLKNIIFKTIETPYIKDYEKTFQDMRFIHIIRNPIQVYSSQKRTLMFNKTLPSWYLGRDNLETMIDKRWIPHAKTILEGCPSKRHYLVKYEDLTKDPVKTITGICDWLGVPLPSEPTKQTVLGGKFMKRLPKNPSKKGADTPLEVVQNLHKLLKYDEVLTAREKEIIIARTYNHAKKLGYFDGITKPNKWTLVSKWILPDRWEVIHSNSPYKLIRTIIALFYRRYYIFRKILMELRY